MAKRLICVIISVLMIVSLLPTGVIADGNTSRTSDSVASLTIGSTTTYYDTVTAAITAAGTSEATVAVFGDGIETSIAVTSDQNISLDFQVDYYGNISVAQNTTTNTSYETLQAAIDAASSGDEIKLLTDATENITIAAGTSVTIDLNGYTWSNDNSEMSTMYSSAVKVYGTLELKDSGTTGTLSVNAYIYYSEYGNEITTRQSEGGAVYVYSGGNFTLTSGTITLGDEYSLSKNGGGVYVASGATFKMNGGTITGFKLTGSSNDNLGYGAGVYNAGTFILNAGTISYNESTQNSGAGVCNASGATFTMNGGTISNNTCDDFGAGVCNYGTFNMIGGTITGNTTYRGGGVYNVGSFNLSGGSITGNTANYGDGIDQQSGATLTISGSPTVTGNTSSNVYLSSGAYITLGNLTTGASIGVTTADTPAEGSPVQITTAESGTSYYATAINYITSDNSEYVVATADGGYLTIGYKEKVYVAELGGDPVMDPTKYESVQDAIDNADAYAYEISLLTDVTEDITIPFGKTVILDLAGHTLTGDVTVEGGTLEIKDSVGNGKIEGDVSALCVVEADFTGVTFAVDMTLNGDYSYFDYETVMSNASYYPEYYSGTPVFSRSTATLTLTNGIISGEVYIYGSTYAMNGGQTGRVVLKYADAENLDYYVKGCYVPASLSTTISSFTMNAGTITGGSASTSNTSAYQGGGVCVGENCTFTMNGGTITDNTAGASAKSGSTSIGGGVYVGRNATFTMSDGTISNNSAVLGGGVAVAGSGAKFTMNGGTITSNSVTEITSGGGGVYVGDGAIFEMTSGTISNNSTTIYTVPEPDSEGYVQDSYVTGEYSGGGVAVSSGTFTMSGGVITGNSSTYGGGVAIGACSYDEFYSTYTGTFTMTGGAIYGNTANIAGADIYALSRSETDVSGGTLSLTLIAANKMTTDSVSFASYYWFSDESDERYSDDNVTDMLDVSEAITSSVALKAVNYTFTLGISSTEGTVTAEIFSGEGTSELYVKVSGSSISDNYAVDAYPTTSLTYTSSSSVDSGNYIFAGWYTTDDDGETYAPCSSSMWDSLSGDYYAKFVDANILTVKVQITAGTNTSSDSTDMRLVSTVDTLDYSCVGYVIYVTKTTTTKSTSVYESLVGSEGTTVLNYKATDFSSSSNYFFTYSITNIPNASFGTPIKVTPYWTTSDGTTVYGTLREITVSHVLSN